MKRQGLRLGASSTLLVLGLSLLGVAPTAAEDQRSAASNEGLGAFLWPDDHGISVLRDTPRRTPTGLLYPRPFELAPFSGDSLLSRGAIELGWIDSYGDTDNARFIEYADWSEGFLLRRFALDARQREGLGYLELGGGSVGRTDQFYRLEAGWMGWASVYADYDSLRHVYADDARVLFLGSGTESLTLPSGLTVGLSTPEQITDALSSVGFSRLSQQLGEAGTGIQFRPFPSLTLSADYSSLKRSGVRPFGGTLGMTMGTTSGGSVIETLEPLASRTHDWTARLGWSTEPLQLNLTYRGSRYDTDRTSLTWENPFPLATIPGFGVIPGYAEGRSALPPDNQLHQVVADLGASLPASGRFTTNVSWTRMSQDAALLPGTINAGIAPLVAPLSRKTANASVDQITMRSRLRFRPIRPLTVQLTGGYFERENDTDYFSVNPDSGFYGYVIEDTFEPASRVGSVPFSYRRWYVEGGLQWRPVRHTRVGVDYEHEVTDRSHRARREVVDDLVRLQVSTRWIPDTTVRLSYEFQHRTGSPYKTTRDQRFYVGSPGDTALSGPGRGLVEFRQYDLANQDRQEVQLRVNWLATEDVDITFVGRFEDIDFESDYGITAERAAEVNAEVSYPVMPRLDTYAYASFEWRESDLSTINGTTDRLEPAAGGGTVPCDPLPNPTVEDFSAGVECGFFPLSNRWGTGSEALAAAVGAGLEFRLMDDVLIEADYRFLWTDDKRSTSFDPSGGALASSITDPSAVRSGFPALRLTDHVLDLAVRYRWSEPLEFKLLYRFQSSKIDNFYQQGLVPLVNQNLYLAIRDDDYKASVVALTAVLRY